MASNPLHALRVPARELLRDPGATREIRASVDASDLGIIDDRITGPVEVDAAAVSRIDGISVDGTASVPWRGECRRCLRRVGGVVAAALDETYADELSTDDDALPLDGDQIDLSGPIREYVLLDLPDDPLCRDDCAGLCPVCGIDRNEGSCTCDTTVRDERWAALDQLRLDD